MKPPAAPSQAASVESSQCVDRKGAWCSDLNLKHPDTFERLCKPEWGDKLGCCKTCKVLNERAVKTVNTTTSAMTHGS